MEDAFIDTPLARLVAVVGLFEKWVFNAGAIRLGVEGMWRDYLQAQKISEVDGKPALAFSLDGFLFRATEILEDLRGSRITSLDINMLIREKKPAFRVASAWWRLIWQQSCAEVRQRFGTERRRLPLPGPSTQRQMFSALSSKSSWLHCAPIKTTKRAMM